MEIRCNAEVYEYGMRTGKFEEPRLMVLHTDENTSAKEIFEEVMDGTDDIDNKFFIMCIKSQYGDIENSKVLINFYSVRTNNRGLVENIDAIGPNSIDQDVLIDAIIGCKPTSAFLMKCNDRIIEKIVIKTMKDDNNYDSNDFIWSEDAKDRLKKVNTLRLKEIYEKLKS